MPVAATTTCDALHIRRRGSTSDNLDQLASNDGLAGSVVENLVLADHLTSVLGSVIHSVSASRLLAGVAFGQSPVEGVGETVLAQVSQDGIVNLKGRNVGCAKFPRSVNAILTT
jgi:hypothetical protein